VLKVAWILLIMVLPTLAGIALLGAIGLWGDSIRRIRLRRWRTTPGIPPLERVAADLRRLHAELTRMENTPDPSPGRSVRLLAVRGAYRDSLLIACRALEVPVNRGDLSRAPAAEIFRLEAELLDRGLDVYPTALH
jgi:hypothetical protein